MNLGFHLFENGIKPEIDKLKEAKPPSSVHKVRQFPSHARNFAMITSSLNKSTKKESL
jgi:hypothetical protein